MLTIALLVALTAPPDADPERPEKPADPPVFYLRDGSRVAGRLGPEHLVVTTRYGRLEVPIDDVLQVRFAVRVDADAESAVAVQIEGLGADDFDARESAMDALRELGTDALPLLRKAAASSDEEIANRAEILVDELQSEAAEGSTDEADLLPNQGSEDEIETRRFRFKGRVERERFTVSSRYGDLDLAVSDLVGIDFRTGESLDSSFSVPGSSSPNGSWFKSKVKVRKGQTIRIRATGQCTIPNYNLVAGPQGTTRYATSRNFQGLPSLALVARVGAGGKAFLVGDEYRGKAPGTGNLQFAVVPYRTYGATGEYKLRVDGGQ